MTLAIGSDHAGFELKSQIINYIHQRGMYSLDKGTFSLERADYADYGHIVASAVANKEVGCGVLICGSGIGISISANRHWGVRAALCWNSKIAALARQHNDANILVLPARFISVEEAYKCLDVFLEEKFEGGRHQERIDKIEI